MSREILLSVEHLHKEYYLQKNPLSPKTVLKAVNDVSFHVYQGETFGLIGESGSGKTTTGELIVRLNTLDGGRIIFAGTDITELDGIRLRRIRKDLQIIFQHSQDALDPKMTIEELLGAPLRLHQIVPHTELPQEIDRLLNLVGISAREKHKFPYQLSGGQKQRISIARAIASRPRLIVCDEPVSALDVSIQGQILNLLNTLKEELNLTYLFISHDLKVVKHVCDRIGVMHNGQLVELGTRDQILHQAKAAYTQQLVSSML